MSGSGLQQILILCEKFAQLVEMTLLLELGQPLFWPMMQQSIFPPILLLA